MKIEIHIHLNAPAESLPSATPGHEAPSHPQPHVGTGPEPLFQGWAGTDFQPPSPAASPADTAAGQSDPGLDLEARIRATIQGRPAPLPGQPLWTPQQEDRLRSIAQDLVAQMAASGPAAAAHTRSDLPELPSPQSPPAPATPQRPGVTFKDLCHAPVDSYFAFLRGFDAGRESAGADAADLTHESGTAKPWSNSGH